MTGWTCMFCGKDADEVMCLIVAPPHTLGLCICNECVGVCEQIVVEYAVGLPKDDLLGKPFVPSMKVGIASNEKKL